MEEKAVVKKPLKSPALAGILAGFFPFGIGAFYNSLPVRGLVYLVGFAALVSLQGVESAQPFIGILLGGFYIYQIIESVQTANRINRRALKEEVEEMKEEVPEFLKTGSIFWGIVLLALGGILILANFEVISYDVVFDFWPAALIIIGLKLIYDYAQKRTNGRQGG